MHQLYFFFEPLKIDFRLFMKGNDTIMNLFLNKICAFIDNNLFVYRIHYYYYNCLPYNSHACRRVASNGQKLKLFYFFHGLVCMTLWQRRRVSKITIIVRGKRKISILICNMHAVHSFNMMSFKLVKIDIINMKIVQGTNKNY